jgi:diguanylate cyclase (GGDEF)-like protein
MNLGRFAGAYLILGFAAILACMLGGLYIGFQHMEVTKQAWLRDAAFREKVRSAFLMRESVRERSFRLTFATIFDDFFERDAQQEHFREAASVFVTAREEIKKLNLTPDEQVALNGLETIIGEARAIVDAAMAQVVEGGDKATVQHKVDLGLREQSRIIDALNGFVKVVEVSSLREAEAASRSVERAQRKMLLLSFGAVVLAFGIGVMVVVREVRHTRELREHRDRLAKLSTTDALTGIANRRRFDEVFDAEWCRAGRSRSPLSLAVMDVDHFKWFNDRYGHAMGDQCLAAVARAVSGMIVRHNDLAARYGGEEFACILADTDQQGAMIVAEKVRKAVEALGIPHETSSVSDHVTVSIGVATIVPAKGDTPKAFFEKADQCLYKAKEGGRNRVVGCP